MTIQLCFNMKVYIIYSIKILSVNKIGKVIQTNRTKSRQRHSNRNLFTKYIHNIYNQRFVWIRIKILIFSLNWKNKSLAWKSVPQDNYFDKAALVLVNKHSSMTRWGAGIPWCWQGVLVWIKGFRRCIPDFQMLF